MKRKRTNHKSYHGRNRLRTSAQHGHARLRTKNFNKQDKHYNNTVKIIMDFANTINAYYLQS